MLSIAHRPCPLAEIDVPCPLAEIDVPCPLAEIDVPPSSIFWGLELFVQYPWCIELTFVFENSLAYNEYRIQNRSNYPDFLKIHCFFYV
jgi:hypothetical protein